VVSGWGGRGRSSPGYD